MYLHVFEYSCRHFWVNVDWGNHSFYLSQEQKNMKLTCDKMALLFTLLALPQSILSGHLLLTGYFSEQWWIEKAWEISPLRIFCHSITPLHFLTHAERLSFIVGVISVCPSYAFKADKWVAGGVIYDNAQPRKQPSTNKGKNWNVHLVAAELLLPCGDVTQSSWSRGIELGRREITNLGNIMIKSFKSISDIESFLLATLLHVERLVTLR